MATSSSKSNPQRTSSQTTQILEHVEMLLALYEAQEESAPGGISELLDKQANRIENRFKQLDEKIENIASTILRQPAIPTAEGGSTAVSELLDEKSLEITCAIESQIEKRFANFESKLDNLANSLGHLKNNSNPVDESQLDSRFDTINVQFDKIAESIIEQRLTLETLSQQPTQDLSEVFVERSNALADSFNRKIESMFEELGSRVAKISQGIAQQETLVAAVPQPVVQEENHFEATTDSASHWHRQKEAMLSKYGIDPEYRPLMELPTQAATAIIAEEPIALPDATTPFSEEDSKEIEDIKERLNAKLREAEVELSISRAKMSRQKANMEAAQVELDRRAAAIEEKYAAVLGAPKRRAGFLERLGRHLGGKKSE